MEARGGLPRVGHDDGRGGPAAASRAEQTVMATSALPDLLYLTQRVPYPPDKGDRIRCFHLIEFLRPRARIHLACLADEPVPEETRTALAKRCHRVEILPVSGPLRWGRALWSLARGRTV